jgi:hypothetical protein
MINFAGSKYAGHLLPMLNDKQLLNVGIVLYVAELIMTFLVAFVIKRISFLVKLRPSFADAYKLAVVVPTPFWLVPLSMFFPSILVGSTAIGVALIISGFLIIYNAPAILRVENEGHAILLSGTVLAIGMVAWAALTYLTLITWIWIASDMPQLH